MSPLFIPLILLLLLGLFAVRMVRVQRRRERSRTDELSNLAAELGLAYEPKADRDFRDAWASLPEIKKQGDVQHLMYGQIGDTTVTFFRHRYVISTGQSTVVVVHWVFSTAVPEWPDIHLRRRPALARLWGARSRVTDDPSFNRDWIIKTSDNAFAHALLSQRTRGFLSQPRADGKRVREAWHVVGGKLCCVVRGTLKPPLVAEQSRRLLAMLDTISGPEHSPPSKSQLIGSDA